MGKESLLYGRITIIDHLRAVPATLAMGLHNFLLRRLVSLLQPWLPEDSDLQLNFGFTRSTIDAHKLHLKVSSFNELIEETATSMSFKEVIVDRLSVVVTYWPFPAFDIKLHGVHVTLSIRLVNCYRGFVII